MTESFGAGTASAIADYVAATPMFDHRLVYSPRQDSPVPDRAFAPFGGVTALPAGHVARIRALRSALHETPDAIVHAHSSFGGAYARLAVRATRRRPIVYTPHCYGFERRDLVLPARIMYRLVEAALALNTSAFAACSPREARLSRWSLGSARVVHVPNAVPPVPGPVRRQSVGAPVRLVGAGRLSRHKDPIFFANAVEALRAAGHPVEATWVGGGDGPERAALDAAGVRLTGWLSREETLERLGESDVYLHSAQWEGMPMAVLEAHAMGLALVVRNIPAFDGLQLPLVVQSPQDLTAHWSVLADEAGRSRLIAGAGVALAQNSRNVQARALEQLYRGESSASPRGRKS
ncbi:glycosyltransferase [Rathayibacter sp. SD072]|uniref:glycosyltransferase n=1 Tax=Rathayibacter sp. SD072 TaxID=2781731 RepID=UPI001A96F4E9|nr:glycosyltransferase [Rathayibacter sp. SD072]MBO0982884.1 glycosyltransferase [Rathayibacter sp. SD072]